MPRRPPCLGSKGRANRPARHPRRAQPARGKRQLCRQHHRPARAAAHRGRDHPGDIAGGRVRPPGRRAIVLHRGRVARPSRACHRVPEPGQPGCGGGSAPAADLDRRGRQRPVAGRGRCRGAGAEPAVGDRHTGPSLQEQRGVAITRQIEDLDDAAGRTLEGRRMPVSRSACSCRRVAVRTFSTPSRPALRAAACGGRPRAGSDTTATGRPASPSTPPGRYHQRPTRAVLAGNAGVWRPEQ
jgi:hypothetical protein